ncbi:MAG: DUF3577 domain-containing protein [Candidatus Thiodiazotropha sp.]
MNAEKTQTEYFDLVTTGLGYLNRSRPVTPTQGSVYESVSIAALHGSSDNPNYTYIDCRVVGAEAIAFVKQHRDAINDHDTKVLVRFNVGDGVADSYEVQKGDHKGKRRHLIKGRLLKITWAKIGDVELDMNSDSSVEGQPAAASTKDAPEGQPEAMTSEQADNASAENATPWEETLGETVKLDKQDPDFMRKKSLLKERGYHWDRDNTQWVKQAA